MLLKIYIFLQIFILTIKKSKENNNDDLDILNYFSEYGYENEFLKESFKKSQQPLLSNLLDPNEKLKKEISFFQSKHGLKITGSLDKQTRELINMPRCALPDFKSSNSKLSSSYVLAKSKFEKFNLKYKITKHTPDLGLIETRRAIGSALKYWSDVSMLQFTEVCSSCESDLNFDFFHYDHNDGHSFDGPGRILAHAFFPTNGNIHFDEAELFTENTFKGINLRIVAAHEIGHALGLEHSFVKEALMYPYFTGFNLNFKLHSDDKLGIQRLYGNNNKQQPITTTKKIIQPITRTPPTFTTTSTRKMLLANIEPCFKRFKTVFTGILIYYLKMLV